MYDKDEYLNKREGKESYQVYMGTCRAKVATTCLSVLSNQMDLD